MKGTAGAQMGTAPAALNAAALAAGQVAGAAVRPAVGADTGAKLWQIKYVHDLSKRTFAGIGYTHLKNDRNAGYNLGGLSPSMNGSKNKGIVVNVGHRF